MAAPDLAEHTVEVLTSLCGYEGEEIEALREEGVIWLLPNRQGAELSDRLPDPSVSSPSSRL